MDIIFIAFFMFSATLQTVDFFAERSFRKKTAARLLDMERRINELDELFGPDDDPDDGEPIIEVTKTNVIAFRKAG